MTQPTFTDEEHTTAEADCLGNRAQSRRYLFWLVIPVIVMYLAPFALTRVPVFRHLIGPRYVPALEYGFLREGENGDVVVFGDSSALLGISVRKMSDDLGRDVINLPNTMGSLPVTGDMALRHYLKTNRPPKLLVFYFTAWDLDYSRQENPYILVGEEMLLLHGTSAEIGRYAVKHPFNSLAYPFQAFASMQRAPGLSRRSLTTIISAEKGHIDASIIAKLTPIRGECRLPDSDLTGHDFSSVQELVARYRSPETKVLVFLAPVPGCKNADLVVQRTYPGSDIQPPNVMNPALFLDDGEFAHLLPAGVPIATEHLVEAVRHALAQPPSATNTR